MPTVTGRARRLRLRHGLPCLHFPLRGWVVVLFRWWRRAAGKPPAVDPVRRLEERLVDIEKTQAEIIALLTGKAWSVDKIVIENMRTDKVELNLDTVDVKDLSGMLSIGINYGPRLVQVSRPNGGGSRESPNAGILARMGRGQVSNRRPLGNGPAINIRYGSGPIETG